MLITNREQLLKDEKSFESYFPVGPANCSDGSFYEEISVISEICKRILINIFYKNIISPKEY